MVWNYKNIHNAFLSSNTIAEMDDFQECIFIRLLLVSDDWGRFPYDTKRLQRMASDFKHTPQQYQQTIEQLIQQQCIHQYEVDGVSYCQWLKWDVYQRGRHKNEALYPSETGEYEPSNNPLSSEDVRKRNARNLAKKSKQVKSSQIKSNQIKSAVTTAEDTAVSTAVKKPDEIKKNRINSDSKPLPDHRIITDTFCACYIKEFNVDQSTINKEQDWARINKRCKELLQFYKALEISNAIQYMFDNHDQLWSEHLMNFTSLVSKAFISRAIGKIRNPDAGREKHYV